MGSIIDKYGTSNPNYKGASTPTGAAPTGNMTIVQKYGTSNPNYTPPNVVSSYDPLLETASKPKSTEETVKPKPNTPNLNIKAFGADTTAHNRTGDVLGAAITGAAGNVVESIGQMGTPQLTIGEQARMALEGKTTEADTQAAQKEKAATVRKNAYAQSDALAQKSAEYTASAKEGLGKGGQFLIDAGIAGTQLAGDIMLGTINPALATGALGVRAFGGAAQEARQAGATDTQQKIYGLANAAVSVGIEKLTQVGKLFKNAYGNGLVDIDDVITKLASKLIKSEAGQQVLASFVGEGAEEAIEAVLAPGLRMIYDNQALANTFKDKEAVADFVSDVGYNFLLGGTLGAIGGAGNVSAPVETTTEAQNTPPNAAAPRTEVEGDTNTPTAQNGTEGVVGANTGNQPITAKMVAETAKDPAQLAQLGIDPNGKTASQLRAEVKAVLESRNAPAATVAENATAEKDAPVKVGRVTTIKKPYKGAVPVVEQKNTATLEVSGDSLTQAQNKISAATGPAGNIIRSTLKEAYKGIFKKATNIPVRGLSFGGKPYTVDVNNSVLGKILSIPTQKAETLALLDILPDVVSNGDYVGSGEYEQHGSKEKPVIRYDYFETLVNIGGTPYVARFDVEVLPGRNNYRTHEVVKMDLTPAEASLTSQLVASSTETSPSRGVHTPVIDPTVAHPTEVVNSVGAAHPSQLPFSHAETLYGILPESARAVRPDDVPRSVDGVTRVSESIPTIKGAAVTPDWFVPVLEENVLKGKYSTVRITNNETVQKCIESLSHKTEREAIDDWIKATTGRITQDVVVTGQLLYNNAVQKGDEETADRIIGEYVEMGTDTARALQAMSIMQKLSPETRLRFIKRSIRRMVEDANIDFDFENDARFNELADQYENAENNEVADAILDDISKYVASKIPTTLWDAIRTIRYTNMLGNLKTQVRNTSGNAVMYAVSGLKDKVAAGLQRLSKNADNTRSAVVSKEMRDLGSEVFEEYKNLVLSQGKYQDGTTGRNDFKRRVKDNQRIDNTGIEWLDKSVLRFYQRYNDLTQWAMNNEVFGDAKWAEMSFARSLGGYLQAKGITAEQWRDPEWQKANQKTVHKAVAFAAEDAQENTFRNANAFADTITELVGKKVPFLSTAFEAIMPFRRTPANIFRTAVDYSPLGFAKTAFNVGRNALSKAEIENKTFEAIQNKFGKEFTANEVIDELAKNLTGSAIAALGALFASLGWVRGGEDDDKKQAGLDTMRGYQPYSLQLGDNSYTIDWLTPASMPFFVGVELYNEARDNGLSWSELGDVLMSVTDPMLEMSMMSGINDAIENVQYSESPLMQFIASNTLNYLSQIFTNTLAGQIERTFEPNRMTTYVDKNKGGTWFQYIRGKNAAKGLGEYGQIEYLDAFGRPQSNGSFVGRAIENLVSPGYYNKVSNDPLEAEIQRLYSTTGNSDMLPSRANKKIGDKYLTAEEYTEYAKARGQEMYDLMQSVVDSSTYKKSSDALKAEMLLWAKDYAADTAEKKVANKELKGWVAKSEQYNINPSDFIEVKSLLEKSGAGSSVSQDELETVLEKTNLSRSEKNKIWQAYGTKSNGESWKYQPYK